MKIAIEKRHFHRAALEIGQSGENDTIPYDIDAQFIKENAESLSEVCQNLFIKIDLMTKKDAFDYVSSLSVSSERLLTSAGANGFRITTKIHPFWNLYLNGLGIGIAEANEPRRSERAHSYRLSAAPDGFFDKAKSWRAYKESSLAEGRLEEDGSVVIQTDISSFYEHIYHHRLENCLADLFGDQSSLPRQIDRILSKIASGRSFGLPVGGQCARVLAEAVMTPIDSSITDAGLVWHRYVDDYTLVCRDQRDAYQALSVLSHALADFGLSLNRTKTTVLGAKHYKSFVTAQLGNGDQASAALRELDLHFDPYSDEAQAEYDRLKSSFNDIDIQFLLDLEKDKSQPDTFVLAQISRSLKFQDPKTAANLCATLLDPKNLDSFRASWSKIMRGVYAVRFAPDLESVHDKIDEMLDKLPKDSAHLLAPESNILHYLRVIRFKKTEIRGKFVRRIYDEVRSTTVRRACVECWGHWIDSGNFHLLRNRWTTLSPEEQRMLWFVAPRFGDEGTHAKGQLRRTLPGAWRLGFEDGTEPAFSTLYQDWANRAR